MKYANPRLGTGLATCRRSVISQQSVVKIKISIGNFVSYVTVINKSFNVGAIYR